MQNIITDFTTGYLEISDVYAATASGLTDSYLLFGGAVNGHSIYVTNVSGVEKLKTFNYNSTGETSTRYLTTTYRISRDGVKWTTYLPLNKSIDNFPAWSGDYKFYIEIKFTREGSTTSGLITLLNWTLLGNTQRNLIKTETATATLTAGQNIIYKSPYVYKVFKITDIEVIANNKNYTISYRYSQDYGRTVTNWTNFTKENIISERITPIRFFQIEYLIEATNNVKIYDINLIGDFQNVTNDSKKTNVYGSREDCNCLILGLINTPETAQRTDVIVNGDQSQKLYQLSSQDKANLFKPYKITEAVNLLTKLSNDVNEIVGHDVVYFLTDPDKNGTDYTFHEYQLLNYVCDERLKVSVDNNQFPDNQITMNQFDLSLFEAFEIHVPKDAFKNAFGVEKRPSKDDFLWFCELNRLYQVEHAYAFKYFNNTSTYYKIALKKYVQKANVIGANDSMTEKVAKLTQNSTINDLFGLENELDKKASSNIEQFKTQSRDLLRYEIIADIDRELIENSSNIISKTNYDLSSINYLATALIYRYFKNVYDISDNFSYTCWFNINVLSPGKYYNFINYYDQINSQGFTINKLNNNFTIKLNTTTYTFTLPTDLLISVWYGLVLNIDQRSKSLSLSIYKRDVEDEADAGKLNSTKLDLVYTHQLSLVPQAITIDNSIAANILASNMRITNIRLFTDIIPQKAQDKILNQQIIGKDTKYLIFADNANERIITDYMPLDTLNDFQSTLRIGTRKTGGKDFPDSDYGTE
jgi:hypothetical protein